MPEIIRKVRNSAAATRFAVEANLSLFADVPSNPSVRRKKLFDELASSPVKEPLNREEDLYTKFLSILEKRQITNPLQERNPYWLPNTPYSIGDVVGTCAQFTDQHGAPLPKTTLPPGEDVEKFIEKVLKEPEPVTIDQQFDMLLDITGNNVIGAANLGMIATRYISRFADQRAYPSLTIEGKEYTQETSDEEVGEMITKWNSKIARFKTYTDSEQNDGIGDGYYFWTHVFAGMALSVDSPQAKAMQTVFERGTELMVFVKYKIARRKGDVLPHFEASKLGRAIGLSLAEQAKENVVTTSSS